MNRNRTSLSLGVVVAVLATLSACGGGEITGTDDVPAGLLALRAQAPGSVAGSFTREGATVDFTATANGAASTLRIVSGSGQVLATSQIDDQGSTLSLLDGRLTYRGAPGQETMTMGGDGQALADLVGLPEARILPWLSQELGAQGLSGRTHPATFALHGFAHFVATAAKIELPPLSMRMSLQADFAAQANNCRDLRRDPDKNGCFGMCGRGCGCWSWVCGDCCWHKGCANHDTACRTCSITHPAACAACSSFSAFFTGGRC